MQSPTADPPWTVERLLTWTREYFERRGVESPRLCAEILLANALGCERLRLFTQYEQTPAPEKLEQFRSAVKSAASGQPIAYIVGRKDFYSLTFDVSPAVLIPRPETELLVERTIALVRGGAVAADARLLDLGTGSGCIAIALAKNLPQLRVCASDVSADALEIARKNAARHALAERIEFRLGDLLQPWNSPSESAASSTVADGRPAFEIIVSNPPYLATDRPQEVAANVRDFEPHLALFGGSDGLGVIRRLATDARSLLTPTGHMLFEIAAGQAEAARSVLRSAGWESIQTYKDHLGHERVLHVRAAAGETAPNESK